MLFGAMVLLLFIFAVVKPKKEKEALKVLPPETPVGESLAPPIETGVEPGFAATDFTLNDFSGKPMRLAALQGKPVLIEFFANWCGACRTDLVLAQKMAQSFKDKIEVIGVHLSSTEHPSRAESLVSDLGVSLNILSDASGALYKSYSQGQRTLPFAVLIDREMTIKKVFKGPKNETELKEAITVVLKSE